MNNKNKHIVLVYFGDFFYDARLNNMALSLIKEKYMVTFIGVSNQIIPIKLFKKVAFQSVKISWKGKMRYLQFYLKVKKILKEISYDIILSGDLYSLAPIVSANKRNKKIIYDCREIYFELAAHSNRPMLKIFNYLYEKKYLRYVDSIMVTAKTDLKLLQKTYKKYKHLSWHVIYNFPINNISLETDRVITSKNNAIKVIYQGVLQKGRGIKRLIRLANYCQKINAIIVGDGEYKSELIKYFQRNDLKNYNNVTFIEKTPYLQLINITKQCDVGWAIIGKNGTSNQFALPNKLFEYIVAEIPVIVSDFENMKNIVEKWQVGRAVSSVSNKENNKKNIFEIFENKSFYLKNLSRASKSLNWDMQHKHFINILK